jgi:glycosyltransferase involved in cell wall biosynthesis
MRRPSPRPASPDRGTQAETAADTAESQGVDPRLAIGPDGEYDEVDVAIVAESTYPYLKGGVSAVIHDIVTGNSGVSFGIIHIAWDSKGSTVDLYGMPPNVQWVRHVYLSMQEHREEFMLAAPASLGMSARQRRRLARQIFDALQGIAEGRHAPFWDLYDRGMNPRTRKFSLWSILGSKQFMEVTLERLGALGLPFTDTFWLLREFFSLAFALLSVDLPRARVYHAHTTGYASVLGAAGARQNGTKFLLTEHNLYVRDTVNFLLDRSMALPLTDRDWREFNVPPGQRAWMAWWIEMAHLCYPSAEVITYLYPEAIAEASELGSPIEKATVLPNGMQVREFEHIYRGRQRELARITEATSTKTWTLAYIARVVPIKGLIDLLTTVDILVKRGVDDFHLEVLGPTDHDPDYYSSCREKARDLHLEDRITFRGTVPVREFLSGFDLLVLPSYNEGQPVVVLEAMTAGIPVVGTDVGGMAQLITDPLVTASGEVWEPCGVLVQPGNSVAMADALQDVMADRDAYATFAHQARGRVTNFFQLDEVLRSYNHLYKELGGLPEEVGLDAAEINVRTIDLIYKECGDPVGVPWDPIEANLITIDLIYKECGDPVGVPWDPIEANLITIDLIYEERGDPVGVPWDPIGANLITIDLIYEDVCGPANVVALDPSSSNRLTFENDHPVQGDQGRWVAVD